MASQKPSKPSPFKDTKKTGTTSLVIGIISLFIIPYMGIGAAVIGIFGAYYGFKQKKGMPLILLNVLGAIVGITSYFLSQLTR